MQGGSGNKTTKPQAGKAGKNGQQRAAAAMAELRSFIKGDEAAHSFSFERYSAKRRESRASHYCRHTLHATCERLGLGHKTSETRGRSQDAGAPYIEKRLEVSRPPRWSAPRSGTFEKAREDLRSPQQPRYDPRDDKEFKCECCGETFACRALALTRNWGAACEGCIDDGRMSAMVGEDVTAYKIESLPADYRQRW